MNDIAERLRTTAGIEDMAGRPFTGNQLREAIAEIARLRDELVEAKAARRDADRACALAHTGERAYRNEMIEAKVEIERLRTALKPFARLARYLIGRPDGNPITNDVAVMHIHAAPGNTVVTVGHVRAARDALSQEPRSK